MPFLVFRVEFYQWLAPG